jgi:hypothetical protein
MGQTSSRPQPSRQSGTKSRRAASSSRSGHQPRTGRSHRQGAHERISRAEVPSQNDPLRGVMDAHRDRFKLWQRAANQAVQEVGQREWLLYLQRQAINREGATGHVDDVTGRLQYMRTEYRSKQWSCRGRDGQTVLFAGAVEKSVQGLEGTKALWKAAATVDPTKGAAVVWAGVEVILTVSCHSRFAPMYANPGPSRLPKAPKTCGLRSLRMQISPSMSLTPAVSWKVPAYIRIDKRSQTQPAISAPRLYLCMGIFLYIKSRLAVSLRAEAFDRRSVGTFTTYPNRNNADHTQAAL